MIGQRLADGFDCTVAALDALGLNETPRGAYWRDEHSVWSVCTPNGRIGSFAKHTVVEYEDGTITVSPSVLVHAIEGHVYEPDERARLVDSYGVAYVEEWERGKPGWHGFLERGVWREV